jgi:hypothetical protein
MEVRCVEKKTFKPSSGDKSDTSLTTAQLRVSSTRNKFIPSVTFQKKYLN